MVTDENIFAWLDGELDPQEAERIAAEVAADAELAERAKQHRAMQARLKGPFDSLLAAVVPEPLLAAVRKPEPEVIDFAAVHRSRAARRWAPLPQWAAVAATLAVGIFVGTMVPQRSNAPVEVQGGKVYAAADARRCAGYAISKCTGRRRPHRADLPRPRRGDLPKLHAIRNEWPGVPQRRPVAGAGIVRCTRRPGRTLSHGRGHGPQPRRAGRFDDGRRTARCRPGESRAGARLALGRATILDCRNGAQGRDRTADTVIFSHVLYQLSYLGSRKAGARPVRATRPLTLAIFAVHPAGRSCSSTGGPGMR